MHSRRRSNSNHPNSFPVYFPLKFLNLWLARQSKWMTLTVALGALVTAASITQLVQFGGQILWNKESLSASTAISVQGPLARAAPEGLRFCLEERSTSACPPCADLADLSEVQLEQPHGFLSDEGEPTALAGVSALTFALGAAASWCGCKRAGKKLVAAAEAVGQQQHGRGSVLRDARIVHRQRLQAIGAGQLGTALV